MILYESHRFGEKNEIIIGEWDDTDFNIYHFHRSFELLYIYDGEVSVRIDDRDFLLRNDDIIIIFPDQTHLYKPLRKTKSKLVIFSPDVARSFYNLYQNKVLQNPVFTLNENIKNFILENLVETESFLMKKSCLYALFSEIAETGVFLDNLKPANSDLVHKILSIIETRFRENITLEDISNELGYNYRYLSRFFNKFFQKSFSTLLNDYRIAFAVSELDGTSKTITEIAHESGYENIRTFNRNFRRTFGSSPTKYRKHEKI